MAEHEFHPALRLGYAITMILLALGAIELAMRYLDVPRGVVSGWRATERAGPVNLYGYRGQPAQGIRVNDYLIVLTGGTGVECLACPHGETLDLMLERAVRQYNQDARVVTLGASGYAEDQAYLALHEFLKYRHADLVVDWASIAEDVPGNTFRTGQPRPGQDRPKPTFALLRGDLVGPTEGLGWQVYRTKLTTLIRPWFIDLDRNWTTLLPKRDPGAGSAPPGAETQSHVDDGLDQQRTPWSIWLTPRPARVQYGMALTRALLRRMRELSTLRGARFALMLTPDPPGPRTDAPVALEQDGTWFLADPATRDAAVAEITQGFDTINLPAAAASPDGARRMMERLAEALDHRGLLTPVPVDRPRH